MSDLVSILIPMYNSAKYIEEAIDSCLEQTHQNFEIICVDDGSTDGTASVVNEHVDNDKRIKYYYKTNGGSASARNYGLEYCTGEFIQLLDADDILLPASIEIKLNKIKDSDSIGCVYSAYCQFNDETGEEIFVDRPEFAIERHMQECLITTNGLYRKCYINAVDGWDESYKYIEDYDFNSRIAMVSKCEYISEPLFKYRKSGQNKTDEASINNFQWHYEHIKVKSNMAKKVGAYNSPNIVQLLCGGIGDLVAMSKSVKYYKMLYPEAKIVHYCYDGVFKDVIEHNPYIDEIITTGNLIESIKESKSKYPTYRQVTMDYFYKYGWNFYKTPYHLVQFFARDILGLLLPKEQLMPEFYYAPDGSDFERPDKFIEKIGKDFVVVESQTRSNKEGKEWKDFNIVYEELDKLNIPIISSASKDTEEIKGFKNVINIRDYSIREAARLIERCSWVFSNQSGQSHISDAFDKKGIMLNIGAPYSYAGRVSKNAVIIDQKEVFSPQTIDKNEVIETIRKFIF